MTADPGTPRLIVLDVAIRKIRSKRRRVESLADYRLSVLSAHVLIDRLVAVAVAPLVDIPLAQSLAGDRVERLLVLPATNSPLMA